MLTQLMEKGPQQKHKQKQTQSPMARSEVSEDPGAEPCEALKNPQSLRVTLPGAGWFGSLGFGGFRL